MFHPKMYVTGVTLQSGEEISFSESDLIVITGPNNSGKTRFLKDLYAILRGDDRNSSRVLADASFKKNFTPNDFIDFLLQNYPMSFGQGRTINLFSTSFDRSYLELMANGRAPFQNFVSVFAHYASTKARLDEANPAPLFNRTTSDPQEPIQFIVFDERIEKLVSDSFHNAFGLDLVPHKVTGQDFPLYVGKRPEWTKENDRTSSEYLEKLERLAKLNDQGDGMKSFAGLLLRILTFQRSILLIDEPEAFLHPPQARLLGKFIAQQKNKGIQVFIATHSKDIIQGIMESRPDSLRFCRITRDSQTTNSIKWLDSSKTHKFMTDALLRVTNALDGLFHERVVLCEGDRDAVFYREMLLALSGNERQTDVLFLNTGGKDKMPDFVDALSDLGVDPVVIADIDLIRSEGTLRKLLEAKRANNLASLLLKAQRITKFVNERNEPISSATLKKKIDDAFSEVKNDNKPAPSIVIRKAKNALDEVSPFLSVKRGGYRALPAGDAQTIYKELTQELKKFNIWLVSEGELEGFLRTGQHKGPRWLEDALSRPLKYDADLKDAREFIEEVFCLGKDAP